MTTNTTRMIVSLFWTKQLGEISGARHGVTIANTDTGVAMQPPPNPRSGQVMR
jgi:hypothetical protein